jgi:hypothetical protein
LSSSPELRRRWSRCRRSAPPPPRADHHLAAEDDAADELDSYDNALAETVIGLYKAKVIYRRGPWRGFDAVEYATLEWVDWFNNRPLLEPIDCGL